MIDGCLLVLVIKHVFKKEGATTTYVVELLTENRRSWNEEALHSNPLSFDAEAAKQIPLGRVQDDFWAWSGERHGFYSIRSAYHLLIETDAQDRAIEGGQSSHSVASNNPRWKKLWRQKVPPKVRLFWSSCT
jgi:hypothetical protein